MSPDSLLHQFDDLKFTAEEQDVVFTNATTIAIPEDDPRLSLVGCVITSHAVDGATLIRVFRAVWKPTKVISITELRSNFFMIRLTSEEARTNILKHGPIIWVRIMRIPIGLMSESLGHSLGACIGSVVGTDTRVIDGNMREFLRVRISIDVSKPLRRCVALGGCGSKPRLCPLQYEKLPNFCHGCGTGADVPSGPAPFVAATPLRSIPVPASVASLMGVATATSLNAEEGVVISTEANVGVDGSHDVSAVDVSGKVHITDNILFGDERDVFVTRVAHEAAAPVVVAPAFDAIEEWLAEDNDSDVQITADLPVKIPAKRSSGADSFRFENCWAHYSECISMIQTTWASTSGTFLDKFSAISKKLKTWQGKRFAKSLGRIRFLQRLLDTSLQLPPSRIPNCQLVNAKLELERLLRANEIYWVQRSHIQWSVGAVTFRSIFMEIMKKILNCRSDVAIS
ncbi:hypothetical protein V6N13_053512 [Hibiscus sabdariffa]